MLHWVRVFCSLHFAPRTSSLELLRPGHACWGNRGADQYPVSLSGAIRREYALGAERSGQTRRERNLQSTLVEANLANMWFLL